MFDIGFWELTLIGVVALLVVGPDRLPALARTVGLWVGRIRRYVSTVRDDIEREIQADELKSLLSKTDTLNPLKDIIDETTSTINDANRELAGARNEADALMSGDGDDETGADAPTPGSAATTLGEAVGARNDSEAPASMAAETSDEAAENTDDAPETSDETTETSDETTETSDETAETSNEAAETSDEAAENTENDEQRSR